jgi:hypothetical protein
MILVEPPSSDSASSMLGPAAFLVLLKHMYWDLPARKPYLSPAISPPPNE